MGKLERRIVESKTASAGMFKRWTGEVKDFGIGMSIFTGTMIIVLSVTFTWSIIQVVSHV
jgi:hypothetical protein